VKDNRKEGERRLWPETVSDFFIVKHTSECESHRSVSTGRRRESLIQSVSEDLHTTKEDRLEID